MEVRILSFPPFLRLRSSTELERKNSNLEVAGSNPAEVTKLFRGSPIGRTLDFESRNRGSNPFPEANFIFSGRSADGYTGMFWKHVFASSNLAAQTKFSLCRRSQMAKALVLETSYCEFDSRRRYQIFRVGDVT